jgi:hypothetical protein
MIFLFERFRCRGSLCLIIQSSKPVPDQSLFWGGHDVFLRKGNVPSEAAFRENDNHSLNG